jgi:hypothetical protein
VKYFVYAFLIQKTGIGYGTIEKTMVAFLYRDEWFIINPLFALDPRRERTL